MTVTQHEVENYLEFLASSRAIRLLLTGLFFQTAFQETINALLPDSSTRRIVWSWFITLLAWVSITAIEHAGVYLAHQHVQMHVSKITHPYVVTTTGRSVVTTQSTGPETTPEPVAASLPTPSYSLEIHHDPVTTHQVTSPLLSTMGKRAHPHTRPPPPSRSSFFHR